jgi:VanZ family protein
MIIKNKFSIIIALIIMYLSLTNSHTFDKVSFLDSPYTDKIVHFAMYFSFMSIIIFENRKTIKGNVQLFLVAMIPLGFGIIMEILQALFTVTRTGSFYDVMANLSGIVASLLIWLYIKPKIKESIR